MKRTLILLSTIFACLTQLKSQDQQFSNPHAPVGEDIYTVPSCARPIMDYWMRDTYVMHGPDDLFYMVGTTATPGREFPGQKHCWDYNDGLYMWKSNDLKSWEAMGLVWSYEKDATWQRKGKPIPEGKTSVNGDPLDSIYLAAWAPELHYIKSKNKWMLVACQNGNAGSFILESTSGNPEGPYINIKGCENGPIFPKIDLSLFEDDNGDVYAVGHNHFVAKMKDDLSDIAEPFKRFKEIPYNPDPYIEGVYIVKHEGKYHLLQTVWSVLQEDGTYTYIRNKIDPAKNVHSYDVVVATADNIYGPYSERYPAIVEGGHNNLFQDNEGQWWSTIFFNPRGVMGQRYNPTCRPSYLAVKWVNGKLMPDIERTEKFFNSF